MRRDSRSLIGFIEWWLLCGLTLLAGCNMKPDNHLAPTTTAASPSGTAPVSTTPPTPPPTPTPTKITQPSILVTQYSRDPASVLTFSGTSGTMYLEIPGWLPAVDGAGNLYVVSCYSRCSPDIDVYSLDAVIAGKPLRSLHTHMAAIFDMKVSNSGEIFVSDGSGVAVFSRTATGDDAPARYIQLDSATSIAVDSSDNLYVRNAGTIEVFGPTATGVVVPARAIGGPHTQIRSEYAVDYGALAVDGAGMLYVLCLIDQPDGSNRFRVLEFGPDANGDVAPLRFVTTPDMNIEYDGTGIAVDAAGTIYVSASLDLNIGAVFEFPADVSGSVTSSKIITYAGENAGGIALY